MLPGILGLNAAIIYDAVVVMNPIAIIAEFFVGGVSIALLLGAKFRRVDVDSIPARQHEWSGTPGPNTMGPDWMRDEHGS